jgi:hypothetical protein
MVRKRWLVMVAMLGLVAAACGQPNDDKVPVIELGTRWSVADAKDLETLATTSDAVFIGTITRLERQELRSLLPERLASEQPLAGELTGNEGRFELPVSTFSVRVMESIAGKAEPGELVSIVQGGGTIRRSDGSEAVVLLESDELLRPRDTYLFFAQRVPDSPGAFSTSPVRRVRLDDDGELSRSGHWQNLDAMKELSALDWGEVVEAIQAASEAAR